MKGVLLTLLAQIDAGSVGVPQVPANDVVNGVLTTVYYVAGIACVIVIIIAGINYTLSNGDSSKVAQAKNMILYGIAGLLVIMFAFVITNFIIGRF